MYFHYITHRSKMQMFFRFFLTNLFFFEASSSEASFSSRFCQKRCLCVSKYFDFVNLETLCEFS